MTESSVIGFRNPLVAALMMTTGRDFSSFMQKYMAYQLLPKHIVDVIETPANLAPYANWAMGHSVRSTPEGDDHTWSGNVIYHLNRRLGVYTIIMPKNEDYPSGHAGLNGRESW